MQKKGVFILWMHEDCTGKLLVETRGCLTTGTVCNIKSARLLCSCLYQPAPFAYSKFRLTQNIYVTVA